MMCDYSTFSMMLIANLNKQCIQMYRCTQTGQLVHDYRNRNSSEVEGQDEISDTTASMLAMDCYNFRTK